ncbi:hypothetical protein AW27_026510 [Streptomyces sp. PCS3-D2]|uniref:hypothetical protein n=1 Tax=Streptomyces sp. PCS3-D2 TaxID=1460244 RepID=UPI00272B748E|nr:hypothetical protein [Streptomyces sp. PCS3-D2]WKV74761.1 hypothetical protein AW27_026510 [Streptomyces sp. PCS3-D2]
MDDDSTPPNTPPRTSQSAVLLSRLTLRAERDRDLATLLTAVYWVHLPEGPIVLSGTLYPYTPGQEEHGARLLDLAADLFGGTPKADGRRYNDTHDWYQLEFTYGSRQVELRAVVPVGSPEHRLRERIAELEAVVAGRTGGEAS